MSHVGTPQQVRAQECRSSGVQVLWICEQLVQSWIPPQYLLQPPRGHHRDTSPEVLLDHGMLTLAKMAELQQEPQPLGYHRSL